MNWLKSIRGTYQLLLSTLDSLFFVCVCVFFRVVDMHISRGVIVLINPKATANEAKREFTFDAVYDWK